MGNTPEHIHRPTALIAAAHARAALADCRLCAHRCGVDRTSGPAGVCRTDASPRLFFEGIEWAGESEIVPTYVVSLSGCNMACAFCLTGGPSQDGHAGEVLDTDDVGRRIEAAAPDLRSVTILGGEPSIHLGGALEIAARIPAPLRFVWKTNAFASPEGLDLLNGIPDVVLADYKFGNDDCARRLAGIADYTAIVQRNLLRSARTSRLIVRHLLMPGHLECCFHPAARWLSHELPDVPMSLMSGFLPVHRSDRHGELRRMNRPSEAQEARHFAESLGLRLSPWAAAPVRGPVDQARDEIWIDRDGRICVDSGSADLIQLLQRLPAIQEGENGAGQATFEQAGASGRRG